MSVFDLKWKASAIIQAYLMLIYGTESKQHQHNSIYESFFYFTVFFETFFLSHSPLGNPLELTKYFSSLWDMTFDPWKASEIEKLLCSVNFRCPTKQKVSFLL